MKQAMVAVVTRTQNRPVLFPRAFESVKSQTCKDFVWVIVNDGGERGYVDKTAALAIDAGIKTHVVHNDAPTGMEAASNKGIRSVDSTFVVIHDDDDSWEPEFLQSTVDFLNSKTGQLYGGVITKCTRVDEVIEKDVCRILGRQPYNDWVETVYLADVARDNTFAPISFLYRRSVYDKVGGYDESLPVLGDWDFNLRFLMQADIHCLFQRLSNYHHRVKVDAVVYGNTVIHGMDKHRMYNTIIANRYLREDLREGKVGLGLVLALARGVKIVADGTWYNAKITRERLEPISWRIGRVLWAKIAKLKQMIQNRH